MFRCTAAGALEFPQDVWDSGCSWLLKHRELRHKQTPVGAWCGEPSSSVGQCGRRLKNGGGARARMRTCSVDRAARGNYTTSTRSTTAYD